MKRTVIAVLLAAASTLALTLAFRLSLPVEFLLGVALGAIFTLIAKATGQS